MNKIEQIKAEIERRTYGEQGFNSEDAEYGYRSCARDLLSFLSTLESEKPMNQDELEEEIDRFEDWMETYNQADYPTSFTTRDIARHFAQWGAEHAKIESEKPIPADLEEAADKYEQEYSDDETLGMAFIAGAKWDRSQMMKEAVEGEVVKDISNKLAVTAKINLDGFKFGDKVRVIVVKEDL